MKKVLICIFILIGLLAASSIFSAIALNITKSYKIGSYNITINTPLSYKLEKKQEENSLLYMVDAGEGINISAVDFKNNFWKTGDGEGRVDEYLKLFSARNYDTELRNLEIGELSNTDGKIWKAEFEISKKYGESDDLSFAATNVIALVTSEEIGSVVIEITVPKEKYDANKNKIENIVKSIKIVE